MICYIVSANQCNIQQPVMDCKLRMGVRAIHSGNIYITKISTKSVSMLLLSRSAVHAASLPCLSQYSVVIGNQTICYIWERVPTKQRAAEEKARVSSTTAHSQWKEDTCKKKEEGKKVPLTLTPTTAVSSHVSAFYYLCVIVHL